MSQVHGSYSRLDHLLITKKNIHQVKECSIQSITISDHSPVTMKFNLGLEPCFRYWRLNVSILTDTLIREEIQTAIKEYFVFNDNGMVSPSVLWDAAKATIRGKIISIGSRLKKQRMQKQLQIENEIKRLENEHKQQRKKEVLDELKENRNKLDDLLTYRAEGALRFIDRKFYEFGNKASRLLAFQLKKAQASRIVPKIKQLNSNSIATSPKTISDNFAKFYEQLYKSQNQESKEDKIHTFFKSVNMAKLTTDEASSLVEPIREEEIRETIGKLKHNKTPGTDGFAGEFYKVFSNDLTPILCKLYNYVLNSGNPPESWSEAIITVLHKEGKDPLQCASYRPISLLCVDYKILTSLISTRIQKYIKKLINPDQTGFILGRQGSNNVRRALNLQSLMTKDPQPSMLLGLDAEKAFDRVDWQFLKHTLIEMGFGETFVSWVTLFYKNSKSKVRVNGCCSEFFNVERGVRQGDSLSPILFALSIEPLAEAIRRDDRIQGIRDGEGATHKISLFADDILLFIKHPLTSVPRLMHCLKEYGDISGYKINQSKSEAMMTSGQRPSQLSEIFHWSEQGFRYLGIILTPRPTQLFDANYTKLIKKITIDLSRWEVLPLSLYGRVETVRMNLLPRLLFLFQSLPVRVPVSTFAMLSKSISQFIWQQKRARIKLKTLHLPKNRGGLALPNLKCYYWAAQISAIVTWIGGDEEAKWLQIEQGETKGIQLSTLPFLDIRGVNKMKIGNEWTRHTLKIWTEVKKMLRDTGSVSRAMPIVGNIDFPPSTGDQGFKRWAAKGLKILNQLFDGADLKSFAQLQEQFGLPANDLYRYLQIRHYIISHKERNRLNRNQNDIEQYFITIAEKNFPTRKHVSHLYKILSSNNYQNTYDVKEDWELESNSIIEDEQWDKLCEGSHKGINSQMWKEFSWKIALRFFRTPFVISRFVKNPSAALCWRRCGKIGDHTHILWDCPVISEYWKGIKEEIETIINREIPSNALFYLLSIIPDYFNVDQKYILHILLLVVKKTITAKWKQVLSPSIAEWKNRVKQVYMMEKMTACLQLKVDKFNQRWHLVKLYLGV